ncbi:MAG: polysaccharide deacetylase family protein [Vicingaceae bacterium]|nr:polysaccharide deacetylase family protein [Vicingaceae bacterium]
MFLAKIPTIIKKYYPKLVWDLPNDDNKIYLTFDDGPVPGITEWVLDLLMEYNIKATFFCIGDNVNKYSQIYQRILAEGHAVGNHTHNHLNGWKTSKGEYIKNVIECQQTVDSKLFRLPYGRIKKPQLNTLSLRYKIVMWDVLSGDFDENLTPKKCYENVVENTVSGSIIVFHDSLKAERNLKYALPKAVEYLMAKGFVFEKLN